MANNFFGNLLSPEVAMPVAGALLGQGGNAANFGAAFGALGQGLGQQKQRNRTLELLMKERPDIAQAIDAQILSPADGYKLYLEERRAAKTPKYMSAGDGYIFNETTGEFVKSPGAASDYDTRRAEAEKNGLSSDDPRYQGYILTGKIPREDAQDLTATDKKAILEADEMVAANEEVVRALGSVLQGQPGQTLNDRAGYGWNAGAQSWLARNDPTGFFNDDRGEATTELNNVVLGQALSSLKSIFGAAPTEGERKILVDLQASIDKSPQERKIILERAKALAERRLAFNRQRADGLRGGSFYKPGGGGGAPSGGNRTSSGIEWSVEP